MALTYTYGTVQKCTTASGSAGNVYEVRLGYALVEAGTSSQQPRPKGKISLQLEVRSTNSQYKPYGYNQTSTIDGVTNSTKTFDLRSTNTWQIFYTREVEVEYTDAGTYSATKSGSFTTNCSGDRPKSGSASVTVTLPTVPRYTTISSFTVSKRNETSLTVNWQTADTVDYIWYSTDWGTTWAGAWSGSAKSGSFNISVLSSNTSTALSPNSTYNCMIRVRRKDSQLTTDSTKVSQTTNAIPTISVASKTETTITINWSCDATVDYIWYSTNSGSGWYGVDVTDGTSGSITIARTSEQTSQNLSPYTDYGIRLRVRRKATQTTYDVGSGSVRTYQYPFVSSIGTSNLTIGSSQTLALYNPLGRTVTVYMKKGSSSGTQLYSGTTSGTSVTFTPTASTLYSSIPSAKSASCAYYCTYSSVPAVSVATGTYSVNESTNKPTLASNSFTDQKASIVALTGDSSIIVLYASNVRISVTASPKNSATISGISIAGISRTVSNNIAYLDYNNPAAASFTVVITDSRGLVTETTVTIPSNKVVNYIVPTMVGVARRNQPTDGKINISGSGKYFNGSFGATANAIETKYCYRESGGSWSNWISMTPTTSGNTHSEAQVQLSNFDYTKNYEFQFKVTDRISTVTNTVTVPKGEPVYYWNEHMFGINGDLVLNKKLQVARYVNSEPTNFRTDLFDGSGTGGLEVIRKSGTWSSNYIPNYSAGLAWMKDSQGGFLIPSFSASTRDVFIGGVNDGTVEWYDKVVLEGRTAISSWTPVISALNETDPTVTYTSQRGYYCKIGKLVFISFYIRAKITALNGTNNFARIKGLPFEAYATGFGAQACNIGVLYGALASDNDCNFVFDGTTIRIQKAYGASATTWKVTSTSYMEVAGSGWYFAA